MGPQQIFFICSGGKAGKTTAASCASNKAPSQPGGTGSSSSSSAAASALLCRGHHPASWAWPAHRAVGGADGFTVPPAVPCLYRGTSR